MFKEKIKILFICKILEKSSLELAYAVHVSSMHAMQFPRNDIVIAIYWF